jgi:hypothetical protein
MYDVSIGTEKNPCSISVVAIIWLPMIQAKRGMTRINE